jgi:hypothetical protein
VLAYQNLPSGAFCTASTSAKSAIAHGAGPNGTIKFASPDSLNCAIQIAEAQVVAAAALEYG